MAQCQSINQRQKSTRYFVVGSSVLCSVGRLEFNLLSESRTDIFVHSFWTRCSGEFHMGNTPLDVQGEVVKLDLPEMKTWYIVAYRSANAVDGKWYLANVHPLETLDEVAHITKQCVAAYEEHAIIRLELPV